MKRDWEELNTKSFDLIKKEMSKLNCKELLILNEYLSYELYLKYWEEK